MTQKLQEFINMFELVHPKRLELGDYSAFISKPEKRDEIYKWLKDNPLEEIERVEEVGRFINFYLSKKFFAASLDEIVKSADEFGKNQRLKSTKIMVEHTQPNPFKEFHIGHLMNNTLGEAIARILAASGAEIKTATYHGDVGMHVAKALWKGDYALGAKAFDKDPSAKAEIEEINKKIYDKSDPDINERYEKGRKESLDKFEAIYKRLGSKFDYHFFESEAAPIGKEIVLDNVGKIFEKSEGAVVFKGEDVDLHTRVFLNSEGLPTYEAKELGLAKMKRDVFAYDKSITITASEQNAFFSVVEVVIGKIFLELVGKLMHLSHGMLRLTTGKMSSRTGDVITALSLIDEVKEKTKDDESVAIGAIKYMILRSNIGGDIIFDVEKSVSTEGDSGVYLQYAHARANSVLEKAGKKGDTSGSRGTTHEIEKILYRFPEVVERAQKEYAPHFITTYLTELAASFNNFYAHEQVISDDAESPYRLAIVEAFKIVMKNGLNILGIPSPEKM